MRSNTRHAVRYHDARQTPTTVKYAIPDARHAVRYRDARQTTTAVKYAIPDARHTVRYRDARQTTAIEECIPADTYCVLAQINTCNRHIAINHPSVNIINTVFFLNKIVTTGECPMSDARQSVSYRDAR